MRESQKIITKSRTEIVTDNIQSFSEEIVRISENKTDKTIEVLIVFNDNNGNIIDRESVVIKNENYELIMSAFPVFAPSKPANEYREKDIWYIIDQMRAAK